MRNGHHPETPPDGSGQTSVVLAAEIRRTRTPARDPVTIPETSSPGDES